jgi:hypothetical protein
VICHRCNRAKSDKLPGEPIYVDPHDYDTVGAVEVGEDRGLIDW